MRIEIVQPGFVGKTVYVFDGEYVKKPGLFGETVYKVYFGADGCAAMAGGALC